MFWLILGLLLEMGDGVSTEYPIESIPDDPEVVEPVAVPPAQEFVPPAEPGE